MRSDDVEAPLSLQPRGGLAHALNHLLGRRVLELALLNAAHSKPSSAVHSPPPARLSTSAHQHEFPDRKPSVHLTLIAGHRLTAACPLLGGVLSTTS